MTKNEKVVDEVSNFLLRERFRIMLSLKSRRYMLDFNPLIAVFKKE